MTLSTRCITGDETTQALPGLACYCWSYQLALLFCTPADSQKASYKCIRMYISWQGDCIKIYWDAVFLNTQRNYHKSNVHANMLTHNHTHMHKRTHMHASTHSHTHTPVQSVNHTSKKPGVCILVSKTTPRNDISISTDTDLMFCPTVALHVPRSTCITSCVYTHGYPDRSSPRRGRAGGWGRGVRPFIHIRGAFMKLKGDI